ncbi:uncharacterized protein LOC123708943 isoform X1 [Pieris brassicae]|uniref:uncharacterized protein LOC123708943 isoform X1 n=1 Tax=Pieris brassicae TaxID=7116 RepID=UPI001E65FB18|nr:uncharacterized protein LOC123708943 isoform X1 [Pieris brassicae]XP_045515935.1 uncharacterized protein LOC123708943 isoform X1 [Pieris brassicae]
MGEIIEISTIRNHQRRFYKFTSKSVIFSVKGNSGYAMVGLADEIGFFNIDHWVFIDKEGKTGVNEFNQVIIETPTPGILEEDKFHKFCLTWYGSKIELSKFGESELIFTKEITKHNLKYVTFFGCNQKNTLQWKLLLPPRIERPVLKPIIGGKPYWVPYNGKLPYGAVIGGYENEFLYIMRAPHVDSLTPGKFVPSMKCGFIGWEGHSQLKTVFEILCGHDCVWVPTKKSVIPTGAFAAGFTAYEQETMYIGRVKYNGHIIPGKVAPTRRACYFAYSDKEAYESYYEILVCPHSNPRCTNTLEPPFKERYEFYKEKYKCDENFYI